jgi:hypothetical protein
VSNKNQKPPKKADSALDVLPWHRVGVVALLCLPL